MEKYSHGAFNVTGRTIHIPNQQDAMPIIVDAWKTWFEEKQGADIVGQEHPSMHAVYYNYKQVDDHTSFTMLIGVMTAGDAMQSDLSLTTITIPPQDYMYTTVKGGFPQTIADAWDMVNAMTADELPRIYGYDLEMYNEEGTECTIAVSVKE